MQVFNTSDLKIEDLISKNKTVVVVISTAWCGPCNKMTPIWEELSRELTDVSIFKVDVTENVPKFVVDMGIRMVPTILIYKNGTIVNTVSGQQTKEQMLKLIE